MTEWASAALGGLEGREEKEGGGKGREGPVWGLAPLAVLNCTTVAWGVLTHAPSYQLGVCV